MSKDNKQQAQPEEVVFYPGFTLEEVVFYPAYAREKAFQDTCRELVEQYTQEAYVNDVFDEMLEIRK
jgi:hypothetical protein